MRLNVSKSKNATSLYIIKSYRKNGVNTSKIVEKLGTYDELVKKLNGEDPYEWGKKRAEYLTELEKKEQLNVIVQYSPVKQIPKDEQRLYNCGYLFLQKLYHQLGLNKICAEISKKYKFEYNLDSILSRLIYGRIIFPASKRETYQLSNRFIEKPDFEQHHIYRALEVISNETDYIQAQLYKNSLKLSNRKSGILYYDCTNYFFEIEQADGIKQYGISKEHRPNPIVQMGLFMDGDGIPLAFSINKGNTNEQITLKPLEKQIIKDFDLSKFVVCTDGGLSSNENKKFNSICSRAYITTRSVKKLKAHIEDWALNSKDWHIFGNEKTYDISNIDEEKFKNTTFYKERWINENGIEERLIITYSIKYRDYQRAVRNEQIARAEKALSSNKSKINKAGINDYKRFIKKSNVTTDGEIAEKTVYSLNTEAIAKEEKYDGFYAVCTNLQDDVDLIIKTNQRRWEIEESFRIMKSEFKARPVYLSRNDRITAHFTTCFLSLVIFRYLEKTLENKFTCGEIITTLRDMNLLEINGDGFVPVYTRTELTDELHKSFDFRTDYQVVSQINMKKILKFTKN